MFILHGCIQTAKCALLSISIHSCDGYAFQYPKLSHYQSFQWISDPMNKSKIMFLTNVYIWRYHSNTSEMMFIRTYNDGILWWYMHWFDYTLIIMIDIVIIMDIEIYFCHVITCKGHDNQYIIKSMHVSSKYAIISWSDACHCSSVAVNIFISPYIFTIECTNLCYDIGSYCL